MRALDLTRNAAGADATVFFEHPGGGAVFSTGSIAFVGSLAHKGYDNNIARLTRNVLRRFLDPAPFTMPQEIALLRWNSSDTLSR